LSCKPGRHTQRDRDDNHSRDKMTCSETGTCIKLVIWTVFTDSQILWLVIFATSGTDGESGGTCDVSVDLTGLFPQSSRRNSMTRRKTYPTLGKRIILYPIFLISCSIRYRMVSRSFYKREAKSIPQILDPHRLGCQGFHKNAPCKRREGGEYQWKQPFTAHLDE